MVRGTLKTMKKIIYMLLAAVMTVLPQSVGAKSMKDLLVSMPDEVMPYLDKNMRLEFAELQEMGVVAEVKNSFGTMSVLDTLTADFIQIRMSKASTLQMKKLPQENGDSIICLVKTFSLPEKESELYLYDQNWKALPLDLNLQSLADGLIQKPDTMTDARFLELKKMIEPKMVSAMLLQHENGLVIRLALPLLSADDKKAVSVLKVQRKLKWDGKTFKES